MKPTFPQRIKTRNNIPLPIECLIMQQDGTVEPWENKAMHYHEYIEILYPLQGDYYVLLNGEEFSLREHSMFIVNSLEPHVTKPARDDDRTLLCIKFMPQVLYSANQSVTEIEYTIPYVFQQFGDIRLFERELLEDTIIPDEFEYVRLEKERNAFGFELALRSVVLRIFTWILRYWHDRAENQSIPSLNSNASKTVRRIREYVDQNYADATLAGAAEACGLSYSYFSRVFKRYMKMSFSDYVNLTRTNHALRLLATTDMSITEIAYSVGFSSSSYFIQTFQKHKHISPNKFRMMSQGNGKE